MSVLSSRILQCTLKQQSFQSQLVLMLSLLLAVIILGILNLVKLFSMCNLYTFKGIYVCFGKVGKLKTLRSFMDMGDGNVSATVCKLAMLSLMEVFKDILPEYRIRVFTSTEKHQKVCHEFINTI